MAHVHGSAIGCGIFQLAGFEETDTLPVHLLTRIKSSLYYTGELMCKCPSCTSAVATYKLQYTNTSKPRCAFVLFSHVEGYGHAHMPLVKFIQSKGLGSLTVSPYKKNPNSHNNVNVYIWEIPTFEQYEAALK